MPDGSIHHAELLCGGCGAWIAWVRKPWTMARAFNFVAPIGKHKGKRMGELPRDYLTFAADNWRGNPQIAAAICLGRRPPDPSGGP